MLMGEGEYILKYRDSATVEKVNNCALNILFTFLVGKGGAG